MGEKSEVFSLHLYETPRDKATLALRTLLVEVGVITNNPSDTIHQLFTAYFAETTLKSMLFCGGHTPIFSHRLKLYELCFMIGDSRWIRRHFIQNYLLKALDQMRGRIREAPTSGDEVPTVVSVDTIRLCRRFIDSRISALSRKLDLSALRDGIHALPDEVIAIVAEYVLAGSEGVDGGRDNSLATLSSISSRFRYAIITHARLWTHISSADALDWVDLKLSRSAGCHLKINGSVCRIEASSGGQKPCTCLPFLQRLIVHRNRWGELEDFIGFDHHHDNGDDGEDQEEDEDEDDSVDVSIRQLLLEEYHLSQLRILKVANVDKPSFYGLWTMPNLVHLTCSQPFSKVALRSPHDSLRSVRVEFREREGERMGTAVRDLTEFLQVPGLARIQRLELNLLELSSVEGEFPDGEITPTIWFNDVQDLHISFLWSDIKQQLELIRQLRLPKLQRLVFEIDGGCESERSDDADTEDISFADRCDPVHFALFEWLGGEQWSTLRTIRFSLDTCACEKSLAVWELAFVREFIHFQISEGWRRQVHSNTWRRAEGLPEFPVIEVNRVGYVSTSAR